jgi:hypothetical protein
MRPCAFVLSFLLNMRLCDMNSACKADRYHELAVQCDGATMCSSPSTAATWHCLHSYMCAVCASSGLLLLRVQSCVVLHYHLSSTALVAGSERGLCPDSAGDTRHAECPRVVQGLWTRKLQSRRLQAPMLSSVCYCVVGELSIAAVVW